MFVSRIRHASLSISFPIIPANSSRPVSNPSVKSSIISCRCSRNSSVVDSSFLAKTCPTARSSISASVISSSRQSTATVATSAAVNNCSISCIDHEITETCCRYSIFFIRLRISLEFACSNLSEIALPGGKSLGSSQSFLTSITSFNTCSLRCFSIVWICSIRSASCGCRREIESRAALYCGISVSGGGYFKPCARRSHIVIHSPKIVSNSRTNSLATP
ncbi:hypothetical protein AX774_g6608 [Zancudomyces culisetae]|uniref:Uncharacterized protein n=1 Tax=Zancudomyces culisetae TaxID=1213189 RepID=A0A1R1PGA7_ZANCU|nr:hypothetical protein AX774_g6608 [Zancudomyces culisetae]|eukprot:OMH79968.1 hypothetical protein AX774_g6608 [Zancudomyces culisetae]